MDPGDSDLDLEERPVSVLAGVPEGDAAADAIALATLLAGFRGEVPVRHTVTGGRRSVADELDRRADELGAGTIVIGSSSHSHLGRLALGDVAVDLLHRGRHAVAVAPRGYADDPPAHLSRVVISFDGGNESRAALELGIEIAQLSRARLSMLSATDGGQGLAGSMAASGAGAGGGGAGIIEAGRAAMERVLRLGLERVPDDVPVNSRLLVGPATEIAGECTEGDLLVAGTHGRGRVGRAVLGSVSADLIEHATAPVLIAPRRPAAPGAT